MTPVDYLELALTFSTELVLLVTLGLVLFLDLRGWLGSTLAVRSQRGATLTAVGLVLAGGVLLTFPPVADAPAGSFVLTQTTLWVKLALLGLSLASVLLLAGSEITEHVGEFCALFLLATEGLLLMVGAENLLMLFVALELSSLSLYALTALNRRHPDASEAALKYFLIGSTAAAGTLFGLSLLYGLTGTLQFSLLAARIGSHIGDPLLWAGLALTLAGFAFKVAAVPFHTWAPDVYQVAPGPAAALVAAGSKLAGFLVLLRLLHAGLAPIPGTASGLPFQSGWMPAVALLAVASMAVGNLAALAQTRVRRLLAWSAIAQAGYALVGILGPTADATLAVQYFAFTYGLAVVGLFGVLEALAAAGESDEISSLAGLWRRSPLLAVCFTTFVLSLAGIPPLAGFLGKFFLFVAALKRGQPLDHLWLVAVALGFSVVSLYYYLKLLKPVLVADPAPEVRPLPVPRLLALTLVVLAAAVLVLGIFPTLLLGSGTL